MLNRISKERGTMSKPIVWLLLAAAAFQATASCVQTRPARNGVPNENQYLRKDFIIGPANSTTPDPGWWLLGTIVSVSTPNPLGSQFELSPGISSGALPVRFVVTEDKLQMVSTREMAATDPQSPFVNAAVVNAWPITNVDLMYYVNLDGELTNQYVTNTEAPWAQREWVQVNFDKNDMSDIAPLGEYQWNYLSQCVDTANVSTTLVPNSFNVDEANNYMEWTVSVTLPLIWDNSTCVFAYGDLGQQAAALGKESVTLELKYSLMRTLPMSEVTYQPLVVAEKDGIHHKYGFYPNITENLDPVTGMVGSQEQVIRHDPTKPINWYFAQGFDPGYKHFFTYTGTGIVDRTNAILETAGSAKNCGTAQATGNCVSVLEYNDITQLTAEQKAQWLPADCQTAGFAGPTCPDWTGRQYGDIRYSFLIWMADQFSQDSFAGVTIFNVDYRTGEMLSDSIAYNTFAFQDYYVQRINDYLISVGAGVDVNSPTPWPTTPSIAGQGGSPGGPPDGTIPASAVNCSATSTPNSCPMNLVNADGTTTPLYCLAGSTLPIQSIVTAAQRNGTSTVFGKMQQYLGLPPATYGNLGPTDFIAQPSQTNNTDFFSAFYNLLPYIIYADPATNPYTIPEGGNGTFGPPSSDSWSLLEGEVAFQEAAANLNAGFQSPSIPTPASMPNGWPYNTSGAVGAVLGAAQGADAFRTLDQAHQAYTYQHMLQDRLYGRTLDGIDSLSFEGVADGVARSCSLDTPGQWQTQEQWVNDITQAYWGQVEFHEFGHSMGLQHNFMGSIDAPHYPAYALGTVPPATSPACDSFAAGNPLAAGCQPTEHTSSIMEYNAEIDRLNFALPDWGPYDKGAIAWIYANVNQPAGSAANNLPNGAPCSGKLSSTPSCGISGQVDATTPWNDPMGFDSNGNEMRYLYCNENDMAYTPFCREGDTGRSPSEIVANELDAYEWQYLWRNTRSYHKFWDDSLYANGPEFLFSDLNRFVSLWAFDWSSGEITTVLQRVGVVNPNPSAQSNGDYFSYLTNMFNAEVSAANQMSAAYHLAMINQAQDERPAATTYDPFYGDVEQQGIILDKYFAMQNFAGLWPATDYDPSQAAGVYLTWYEGIGDETFGDLTQWGIVQMLGGIPNVFPYFQPTTIALYAQDTHDPAFGYQPARNWIGGHEFWREQDFLQYFQQIAVAADYQGPGCQDVNGNQINCDCTTQATCTYDPRNIQDPLLENQLLGPDGRRYIWSYIQDRNEWAVAEQDTNVVTNTIMLQYNADVVAGQDDGNVPGAAFSDELPIKYTVDSFTQFN